MLPTFKVSLLERCRIEHDGRYFGLVLRMCLGQKVSRSFCLTSWVFGFSEAPFHSVGKRIDLLPEPD
jgi:hypothetical protein